MSRENPDRPVHTEHMLFECWVDGNTASATRLFRAPTVLDGSGTHKRLPHEVGWDDPREGDLVVAVQIEEVGPTATVIAVLQFWHVLEARDGEARVLVNNLVGSAGDAESVYDRLAGLVGMPPSTRE